MNKKKSEKEKERDERAREKGTKRKAKLWRSRLLDREFFGRGRLWLMLFHSETLNRE